MRAAMNLRYGRAGLLALEYELVRKVTSVFKAGLLAPNLLNCNPISPFLLEQHR